MTRPRRYGPALAVALLVAFTGIAAGTTLTSDQSAQTATQIDSCTTITEPGVYVLTGDVIDAGAAWISEGCIVIRSDDVVFQGRGHLIDGRGVSDTRGVMVNESVGATNVTVRNVTLIDWNIGVYYQNVTGGEIRNVTAYGNGYGINLDGSSGVSIRDNEVSRNLVGIDVKGNDGSNTLSDNAFDGNYVTAVLGADDGRETESEDERRSHRMSGERPVSSVNATPPGTPL